MIRPLPRHFDDASIDFSPESTSDLGMHAFAMKTEPMAVHYFGETGFYPSGNRSHSRESEDEEGVADWQLYSPGNVEYDSWDLSDSSLENQLKISR